MRESEILFSIDV